MVRSTVLMESIGRFNLVNTSILSKWIYEFNAILMNIPEDVLKL